MVLPQPMPIWVDAQASDMPKTASAKLQVIRVSTGIGKKTLNITLNVPLDLFLKRTHLGLFRDATNFSRREMWSPKAFPDTLILHQNQ